VSQKAIVKSFQGIKGIPMAPLIAAATSKPTAEQQDNDLHYSETNIKTLATLEIEALERFPFNSVYPNAKELRRAVRQ
jgi:hypothetical protein